jgi:hypothetical protein
MIKTTCFFPHIREFARDEFADDCFHRQIVSAAAAVSARVAKMPGCRRIHYIKRTLRARAQRVVPSPTALFSTAR